MLLYTVHRFDFSVGRRKEIAFSIGTPLDWILSLVVCRLVLVQSFQTGIAGEAY